MSSNERFENQGGSDGADSSSESVEEQLNNLSPEDLGLDGNDSTSSPDTDDEPRRRQSSSSSPQDELSSPSGDTVDVGGSDPGRDTTETDDPDADSRQASSSPRDELSSPTGETVDVEDDDGAATRPSGSPTNSPPDQQAPISSPTGETASPEPEPEPEPEAEGTSEGATPTFDGDERRSPDPTRPEPGSAAADRAINAAVAEDVASIRQAQQGVETRGGLVGSEAREFEDDIIANNPGLDEDDVAINRVGNELVAELTPTGEQQRVEQFEQDLREQAARNAGVSEDEVIVERTAGGRYRAGTEGAIAAGRARDAARQYGVAPSGANVETVVEGAASFGIGESGSDVAPAPRFQVDRGTPEVTEQRTTLIRGEGGGQVTASRSGLDDALAASRRRGRQQGRDAEFRDDDVTLFRFPESVPGELGGMRFEDALEEGAQGISQTAGGLVAIGAAGPGQRQSEIIQQVYGTSGTQPAQNRVEDIPEGLGEGAAGFVAGIPQLVLKEAPEFAYEGATSTAEGEGADFAIDTATTARDRFERTGTALVNRPIAVGSQITGSLVASGGLIGGARRLAGPDAARTTSYLIQPGEELVRTAVRRGAVSPRVASTVPGVGDSVAGRVARRAGGLRREIEAFARSERGQAQLVGRGRSPETESDAEAETVERAVPDEDLSEVARQQYEQIEFEQQREFGEQEFDSVPDSPTPDRSDVTDSRARQDGDPRNPERLPEQDVDESELIGGGVGGVSRGTDVGDVRAQFELRDVPYQDLRQAVRPEVDLDTPGAGLQSLLPRLEPETRQQLFQSVRAESDSLVSEAEAQQVQEAEADLLGEAQESEVAADVREEQRLGAELRPELGLRTPAQEFRLERRQELRSRQERRQEVRPELRSETRSEAELGRIAELEARREGRLEAGFDGPRESRAETDVDGDEEEVDVLPRRRGPRFAGDNPGPTPYTFGYFAETAEGFLQGGLTEVSAPEQSELAALNAQDPLGELPTAAIASGEVDVDEVYDLYYGGGAP